MNTQKTFRILIVEDNDLFNELLTAQLKWFAGEVAYYKNVKLEIKSYLSVEQCLSEMKDEADIAFVDYYLGNGKTAMDIIGKIKEQNLDCKIFILSQVKEVQDHVALLRAVDFLYKDNYSVPRICFITEEILKEKIRTIN
jgi:DNA-binding response OmpR family regulator